MTLSPAPELVTSMWFNTKAPVSLTGLAGKVVVLSAFQMLCPGCVEYAIPQTQEIYDTFPRDQVVVIGIHTVFEHHEAMGPASLAAFLKEYRIMFPVAVDEKGKGPIPKTMEAYAMQGTPTLILVDRQGRRRAQHFGQISNMRVGAEIATLLSESKNIRI